MLVPYLDGGAGGSWRLGDQTQALAITTADLEVDETLRRGYDAAPGLDLGLLHQSDRFSLLGGVRSKAWIVSDQHREDSLYLNGSWHFGRSFSLAAEFERTDHYDRIDNQWQLGLHAYF